MALKKLVSLVSWITLNSAEMVVTKQFFSYLWTLKIVAMNVDIC